MPTFLARHPLLPFVAIAKRQSKPLRNAVPGSRLGTVGRASTAGRKHRNGDRLRDQEVTK